MHLDFLLLLRKGRLLMLKTFEEVIERAIQFVQNDFVAVSQAEDVMIAIETAKRWD